MTEVEALQAALAGEHACVYGYGVVAAWVSAAERRSALAALTAHAAAVDALADLLRARHTDPVAALPAYALPFPVANRGDGLRLAATIEERLAAAYLPVLGATDDVALRRLAAGAVQRAAVAAQRWRELGRRGLLGPFPGR